MLTLGAMVAQLVKRVLKVRRLTPESSPRMAKHNYVTVIFPPSCSSNLLLAMAEFLFSCAPKLSPVL